MTDNKLDSTDRFFGNFILVGLTALSIMLLCSMCSSINEQEDRFNKECMKYGGELHIQYRSASICIKKDSVIRL